MGYYTNFNLTTIGNSDIAEILAQIPEEEFEDKFYAIDECGDCNCEAKWYEHETDIRELSLKFPEVVFVLSGEGEEKDDIWKKYFQNGKMQVCRAEILFPVYDEKLLK